MKTFTLVLFLLTGLLISHTSYAVVPVAEETTTLTDNQGLNRSDLEATLGRKVKLHEWIAFKMVNKKARKSTKAKKTSRSYYEHDGHGFAVAGMVLGILGLVSLNFLFPLLGIIFSAIALARMRRTGSDLNKGMAKAGLICGIVGLVLFFAIVSIYIAFYI